MNEPLTTVLRARSTGEERRLNALRALDVFETEPEAEFDAIVRLTAAFCETPIALLSLVGPSGISLKSHVGYERNALRRDGSFCSYAIRRPGDAFVVHDAARDVRFRYNELTRSAGVRFYAGVPLLTSDRCAIGTLCTMDRVPRTLDPHQIEALRVAARTIVILLEKRRAVARLRLLELVAVHANDGVAIVTIDEAPPHERHVAYTNRAFTQLTGFTEDEARSGDVAAKLLELTRRGDAVPRAAGERSERVVEHAAIVRKDGSAAEVEISLSPVAVRRADQRTRNVVVILRDVTDRRKVAQERARADSATLVNGELQREIKERRRVEHDLFHAATHDALTGLPNRTLFKTRLESAVARYRDGAADSSTAVVFIDLDRFKKINDSLGHLSGDELLVSVASRLRLALRSSDMVARFAGDEFTVLLENLNDEAEAASIVDRLARVFSEPFRLGSSDVFVTASIGTTFLLPGHACAEDALRDADIAMFAAKDNGRARAQFFNRELDERASAALALEASLHAGLERNEFRLVYQPIFSLLAPGHPVRGFEALLRWHSPRGELSPARFIAAAEETGLIVPLGSWVLGEACARLATWHRELAGQGDARPTLSVNVSAKQFVDPAFLDQVDVALARYAVDARYLAFELTETTLMDDVEAGRAVLAALRERGVKIYLDDFGTGYCSFGYLQRFAVDCLKIDRSFVSGGDGPDQSDGLADPEIVRAIVTLARSLHLTTIAEGVETDSQRAALVELGCDAGQGFFFSKPLEDARDAFAPQPLL